MVKEEAHITLCEIEKIQQESLLLKHLKLFPTYAEMFQYNFKFLMSIIVGSFINIHKLNTLKDYQVTLYPDMGKAVEKWSKIDDGAYFDVKVNTVLENSN